MLPDMQPSGAANSGMITKPRGTASASAGMTPCGPTTTTEIVTRECGVDGGPEPDVEHVPLNTVPPIDMTVVTRNLWLFIWLKTIGSHDSGAFSAAVAASDGIAENWSLSYSQQGTLTSSVFLGNILGCPLAGQLFYSFGEKNVLVVSLIIHTVFTFLFACFSNYYLALVNRFFIGLTLAFIVVYTPVWVDEFAPKERQSMWMASHNAGVPLGIMFGYLLAAFFPTYTSIGWEWAFYIKCVLMVPTIAYLAKVDKRTINTKKKNAAGQSLADQVDHDSDGCAASTFDEAAVPTPSGNHSGLRASLNRLWDQTRALLRSTWHTLKPIVTNVIFMCSVLAMSSLYFVATGLQNFVTQYLREDPFNASMRTIMAGFGASVVTAPVCGVVVGGILLDRIGGYQRNLFRVSLFACGWGAAAALAAIVCIFIKTTTGFLIVMSLVLFCGGAIIPPGLGLTMSTLSPHLRSMAAAFSQTLYNLLGNFSGPLVCGQVAEWTGELKYGIMVLLLSSILGLIPMGIIFLVAWRARLAAGPLLEVPDAVAVVTHDYATPSTEVLKARDGQGGGVDDSGDIEVTVDVTRGGAVHLSERTTAVSVDRRESQSRDDGEPLDLARGTLVPFPSATPSSASAVTPPGRVTLSDVQSARWSRGPSTTSQSQADFSPLKRTLMSGGAGTVDVGEMVDSVDPAAKAVATTGDVVDQPRYSTTRTRTARSELGSMSDLAARSPPDMIEELPSQTMQAMPIPYMFGIDVVRTLLHPPSSMSAGIGTVAGDGGSGNARLQSSSTHRARSERTTSSLPSESPVDHELPGPRST